MNPPGSRAAPFEDPDPREPRLLLLGLGNEVCGDDAIGLLVVRALALTPPPGTRAEIRETTGAGLALLDELPGFDDVLLVDAVVTGRAAPGTLQVVDDHHLPRISIGSPHFLGVGETLDLGRMLGLPMPRRVRIAAIEVADPYTLQTRLTPALAAALPGLVRAVRDLLGEPAPPAAPPPRGAVAPALRQSPCPTR